MSNPQREFKQQLLGNIIEPIKPLSYEFSGMTGIEETLLFENGCIQWLPENELQVGLFFDTYGCVSFSFNNGLETDATRRLELGLYNSDNSKWLKENYLVNGKINFSDRDLVVISGTNPEKGNNGWTVFDAAKDNGLICESDAPWDFREPNPTINNKANYYSYTRSEKNQKKADEFKKRFEIKAEWVVREKWLEASKYGVLQVYTKAWFQRNGKYYNPEPGSNNHAVILAKKDEEKVFDHYEPFIKQMERDEDFYYLGLKLSLIEKNMEKPKLVNNTLVILTSTPGGIGLYLDGNIIIDDEAKINSVFMARNSKNGFFSGGPVKSLEKAQWDMFPKVNLKGEAI